MSDLQCRVHGVEFTVLVIASKAKQSKEWKVGYGCE